MKSVSKVIKIRANSTEAEIEAEINAWLNKSYELKMVESFGSDIRIYLIRKI